MSNMATSQPPFTINLHTMLNTNQAHDSNAHSAPELLRGHSLDSTVWPPTLKDRQMWNLDFKSTKLPIVDTTELKVTDSSTIGVTHWNHLPASEVATNSVMTEDIGYMHLYGNSNDQVVG